MSSYLLLMLQPLNNQGYGPENQFNWLVCLTRMLSATAHLPISTWSLVVVWQYLVTTVYSMNKIIDNNKKLLDLSYNMK
jgi:hypothetical protein